MGWRNICYYLDSFFVAKLAQPKDSVGILEKKLFQGGNGTEKAAKGEGGEKLKAKSVDQKHEEIKSHNQGWMGVEQHRTDWRKAVVVYRYTMHLS